MLYGNAYDVAGDAPLVQRTTIATVRAALDIYAEDAGTAGHVKRAQLATAVLASPDSFGRIFAFVVVSDPQFANQAALRNAVDATLLTVVKTAWNAVAGA